MPKGRSGHWTIWVDTGGTFTDCLALDPEGELHRVKVLSSSALRGRLLERLDDRRLRIGAPWPVPPDFFSGYGFRLLAEPSAREHRVASYDAASQILELARPARPGASAGWGFELLSPEEAPILAARLVTRTPLSSELPPLAMRLATTRGTNALLERRGAPVALFITRGFGDLLLIGTQQRPELFVRQIEKPLPLYQEVVEVTERLAADGTVLQPLDLDRLSETVDRLLRLDVRCAAVALLHSYRNPTHEEEVARFLRHRGFEHVSCSSEVAPLVKIVPRAETTVIDAYLAPIIRDYLDAVTACLDSSPLHVMTSAGGLVRADAYLAKDCLLSGPAGGVVGAALAGERSDVTRVIAFDMGGTSTDVARVHDDYEYTFEHRVGDARIVAPALAIESVAAGGGSICSFDGTQLKVGPESAGADPGPACYGAGGPLTLTDVNLLLGRLDPDRFEIPIDPEVASGRLDEIHERAEGAAPDGVAPETLLDGFLEIANERMADAIRRISVQRGYDPAEYALVAFGGAGGQHACAVAELLGMRTVLVPRDAGLLSALGLGAAVVERFAHRQALEPLARVSRKIPGWLDELAKAAVDEIVKEGVDRRRVEVRRRLVNLRLAGQDSVLTVECRDGTSLEEAFVESYAATFGYRPERRPIEVESLRVVASSRRELPALPTGSPEGRVVQTPGQRKAAFFAHRWRSVPVFEREQLPVGWRLSGPALVTERHAATVVEVGWGLEVDAAETLVLRR